MPRLANISRTVCIALAIMMMVVLALNISRRGIPLHNFLELTLYIVIPAAGSLAFAWVSRLAAPTRFVFILTVAAAGGAAYAAEFYLQVLDHTKGGDPTTKDPRKGAQVVLDLRAQGKGAFPFLALRSEILTPDKDGKLVSVFGDLLPLAGIPGVFTVLCNESGEWLSYVADQHGFNNPQEVWSNRSSQLALVGDSFTHGSCVTAEQHFSGILRAAYPATVNLGRSGTGPLYQLATIKEYLPSLKPGRVLWFFVEDNDIFGDLRDELTSPQLYRYLESGYTQNLINRQWEAGEALRGLAEQKLASFRPPPPPPVNGNSIDVGLADRIKLTHVRGLLKLGVHTAYAEETTYLYGVYTDILRQGRDLVAGWGGEVTLVYLPSAQRYSSFRLRVGLEETRHRAKAITAALGIPMIDLVPAFDAQRHPLSLYQGHYTPLGYRLVSDEILKSSNQSASKR